MIDIKKSGTRYIKNNRMKAAGQLVLLLFAVVFAVFVYNDSFMYGTPIVKVVKADNEKTQIQNGNNGEEEQYYRQSVTGKVLNGEYKGKEVTLSNEYSYSGVRDEKYVSGDRLFVSIKEKDGELSANILNMKKDFYIVVMCEILILVLLFTAGKSGFMTIISMCVNIGLLYGALKMYMSGIDILNVFQILIIVYSVITLTLISGFKKQTIATIVSTLITVIIIYIIYFISVKLGNEPEYIMLEYIVYAKDLDRLFMAEVLVGGLGAIMDVAVSMASAVNELVNKNNEIEEKTLYASVKEIGHDIMGTMINVLLFSFISGSIPMLILQIKNSYRIGTIISLYLPFEIIRFLVGAIGIVLAIPISGFISVNVLKYRKKVQTND